MPGARSSTTAIDCHLPLTHVPEHTFDNRQREPKSRSGHPALQSTRKSRAGTTVNVAGEDSKGLLFIELCIACAYPSTPVLSGLCRTCGSIRGAATSLLIRAVQHCTFGVDNNLFGVSGQVTAPGVLAFSHIFGALRAG